MTRLVLTYKERSVLENLAIDAGDVRLWRRVQALLWRDEGDTVEEIVERLRVSRQSVYNWLTRFQHRDHLDIIARLADGERSGRPRTAHGIIDPLIAAVIDRDPRDFGYRSTVWISELLGRYLSDVHSMAVSHRSIRLAIDRLDISWKRPRHELSRRSNTWRQAKGGSNAAFQGGFGP